MEINPELASRLINAWQNDPTLYFRDVLGVEKIWRLQQELLDACPRAIKEHKHVYVGSGHSLGKDWVCGGIGLWFLHCFSPSIVLLTGPTDRQVKKVMWGETMAHWNKRKIDLGGKPYKDPYLEIRQEDWFMLGFTTKESGASSQAAGGKFQGFHAPNVCVIVTEAQAVEDNIFDQIDAVTTNENVLVIFLGNPTRASGRFAKGLRDKKNNIVFNFSCLENPNYQRKETVIPGLCSYEWVEDKRIKWGESDPRWQGRVLGQIPDASVNNVFTEALIKIGREVKRPHGIKANAGVSLDIAGEGDDDNVFYSGDRGVIKESIMRAVSNPSKNAIDAQRMCADVNGQFIIVDCDGLGIGTWQELNQIKGLNDRLHLIKYHGSQKYSRDKYNNSVGYENLRALAYFTAKERLEQGLAHIPDDEMLIEELLEVKFFENNRGMIQLEDKDDIKERLDRSPDRADAWVMLQYGFSLNLESKVAQRRDPYALYGYEERYEFNPATV